MRRTEGRHFRTASEIDELVALARCYCEVRAGYLSAKTEGRLSPQDESQSLQHLNSLNARIDQLKSNNELDRQRARKERRVIPLAEYARMAR